MCSFVLFDKVILPTLTGSVDIFTDPEGVRLSYDSLYCHLYLFFCTREFYNCSFSFFHLGEFCNCSFAFFCTWGSFVIVRLHFFHLGEFCNCSFAFFVLGGVL